MKRIIIIICVLAIAGAAVWFLISSDSDLGNKLTDVIYNSTGTNLHSGGEKVSVKDLSADLDFEEGLDLDLSDGLDNLDLEKGLKNLETGVNKLGDEMSDFDIEKVMDIDSLMKDLGEMVDLESMMDDPSLITTIQEWGEEIMNELSPSEMEKLMKDLKKSNKKTKKEYEKIIKKYLDA